MNRTVFITLALLWLLSAAIAGCGSGVTRGGDETLGDLDVTYDDLGGVHHFGDSPCPQPVGSFVLTNAGTIDILVDMTQTSSQVDLSVVAADGSRTPWVPTTLARGAQLEVQVFFNCSSTSDVHTDITVHATPTGGTEGTFAVPFDLVIEGEP